MEPSTAVAGLGLLFDKPLSSTGSEMFKEVIEITRLL